MKSRIVAIVIALLVVGMLPLEVYAKGPGTTGQSQGNQGLQYGQPIDDSGHVLFTDAIAMLIAQSGAGRVRINFRLGGFHDWTETTTFGYSALSLYDQVVANARNNGLQVLGLLSNESMYGSSLSEWQANSIEAAGGNGDNAYIQSFAKNAAVVLAQHYAGQVDWWEVWNEPNMQATYMYPSNFAWLLAHVYTDVKTVGVTNARFLSGGITSLQDSRGQITTASTGANYLQLVYTRGKDVAGWESIKTSYGSYPLDGIGQHIYIDSSTKTTAAHIASTLNLVRNAYVAGEGGSTTKKTFVTEVGWATNNISERTQAGNLQTAYGQFKKTAYVQTAYWFFLKDEPAAGLYYGLLRSDMTQKPSWASYQTYANY